VPKVPKIEKNGARLKAHGSRLVGIAVFAVRLEPSLLELSPPQ
jgi:hypothetical protein